METIGEEGTEVSIEFLDELAQQTLLNPPVQVALEALGSFEARNDAYAFVIPILESESTWVTKFHALMILKTFVSKSWDQVAEDDQNSFKEIVIRKIGEYITTGQPKQLLGEANSCLVTILSEDWPDGCPEFVSIISGLITESEPIFVNYLSVFRMLAEDVNKRALSKVANYKIQRLAAALPSVFETFAPTIKEVTTDSEYPLVEETFNFISAMGPFIDPSLFVESGICRLCFNGLDAFPVFHYQILTAFTCIVSSRNWIQGEAESGFLFNMVVEAIAKQYGDPPDFAESAEGEKVCLCFIEFFIEIFQKYRISLEKDSNEQVRSVVAWLINFVQSDHDSDVKRSCYDFFTTLVQGLWEEKQKQQVSTYGLYTEAINEVTKSIIYSIDKPYAVMECDDGIQGLTVKEMNDTESLFSTMRTYIVLATNLDSEIVFQFISEMFEIVNSESATPDIIRCFCSSVGAIAGALPKNYDSEGLLEILTTIIQLLQGASDMEQIDELAQGILYMFTCCDRIMNSNYELFYHVVEMVFSYMNSSENQTTRALAVYAFTVIANNCQKQFIDPRSGEVYLEQILGNIDSILPQLDQEGIIVLFGALSKMIRAIKIPETASELLNKLAQPLIEQFMEHMTHLDEEGPDVAYMFLFFLRCFSSLFKGAGLISQPYIEGIFEHIINVYTTYGQRNFEAEGRLQYAINVMKSCIMCIESFAVALIAGSETSQSLTVSCIENFADTYVGSDPSQRVSKVPGMFGVLLATSGKKIDDETTNAIFEKIFLPTAEMISFDHTSFSEFRESMIKFLRGIITGNCEYIASLPDEQKQQIFDVIIHLASSPYHEIAIQALNLLPLLAKSPSLKTPAIRDPFIEWLLPQTIISLFNILSDTIHKFMFDELAAVIKSILSMEELVLHNDVIITLLLQLYPEQDEEFFRSHVLLLMSKLNNERSFMNALRDFMVDLEKLNVYDLSFRQNEKEAIKKERTNAIMNVRGMMQPTISAEDKEIRIQNIGLSLMNLKL